MVCQRKIRICRLKIRLIKFNTLISSCFTLLIFLFPILSPSQETSDLSLAKKLMSEGLYELAYDGFLEFAENNRESPDAQEAYYLANDCLFLQGKYSEALSGFDDFISTFPLSPFTSFAQERIGEIYLKQKKYKEARKTFENFITVYPENEKSEDALFWLGETHYGMGEFEKARYYYTLCMERYPDGKYHDYALFSLGFTYRKEKDYDNALKYFHTLIEKYPNSSVVEDAYLSIGEIEFERGEYESALDCFNTYREKYPQGRYFDKVLLYTGKIYVKKSDTKSAIKIFASLVRTFPDSEYKNPALYYIAWIYFEKGNYEKALEFFGMVERKSSLYYPSFYWTGIIYERQGKRKDALRLFEELSKMEGAGGFSYDGLYELARIGYESKEIAKGDSLVSLLEGTSRKWKALLLKANSLFEMKRYEEAIEIYSRIVQEEENGVRKDAIYRLASSLFQREDYKTAEDYLNVYLTNYPEGNDRKEAMLLFAECAYKQNKWNDALERYRNVKSKYPQTREADLATMGEGWTLSKLGRDKEAYEILNQFKGVEGEEKDYMTLGDAAYNAGRFSEAIKNYKKAAKEKGKREVALLKLGNTYFRTKKYSDAIKTYDDLIAGFPVGDFADDAYFKKGESLRKLGDYESSLATFESLRKLYPSSPFVGRSYLLSGDNYFNRGDFENARIHYQKLIDILKLPGDTTAITPINGIMKCIQRKDGGKRAAEFADTYIDRFQGTYLSEKVRMLKADLYYYSGDIGLAEEEYGKVENKRLKPTALYYQARSLQLLKRNVDAEQKLKELLNDYPQSRMASKAALLLGKVLFEERKYSESLEFLEKSKKMETDEDFEVAYIKAEVYLKLNHRKKAIETLNELVGASKGKWKGMALIKLGDIMVDGGEYGNAISSYDEAIKTGESVVIPEAYYKKGIAQAKQGLDKEALKTFLKVKYNLPESKFKTKAIFEAAELSLKMGKKQDAASLYKEVIERNDDNVLSTRSKEKLKTLNP
jgi:tol-pal system protein YbgF